MCPFHLDMVICPLKGFFSVETVKWVKEYFIEVLCDLSQEFVWQRNWTLTLTICEKLGVLSHWFKISLFLTCFVHNFDWVSPIISSFATSNEKMSVSIVCRVFFVIPSMVYYQAIIFKSRNERNIRNIKNSH